MMCNAFERLTASQRQPVSKSRRVFPVHLNAIVSYLHVASKALTHIEEYYAPGIFVPSLLFLTQRLGQTNRHKMKVPIMLVDNARIPKSISVIITICCGALRLSSIQPMRKRIGFHKLRNTIMNTGPRNEQIPIMPSF